MVGSQVLPMADSELAGLCAGDGRVWLCDELHSQLIELPLLPPAVLKSPRFNHI